MRVFKIWAAFLGCGAWAGKISGKNRESGVCGGTFLFLDQAVLAETLSRLDWNLLRFCDLQG